MTNTETPATFAHVAGLTAGVVLAEWADLGPLVSAPEIIGQVDGVTFAAVRFASGTRKLPLDAEVRVG